MYRINDFIISIRKNAGGEMTQALYAHMNNKKKRKKEKKPNIISHQEMQIKSTMSWAWVAHACNPSNSGGRDQEDHKVQSQPPSK
jgi:uncharacterized protein YdgA (DUF945 family)